MGAPTSLLAPRHLQLLPRPARAHPNRFATKAGVDYDGKKWADCFPHEMDRYMHACILRYQMSESPMQDPADAGWRLGPILARMPGFVATIVVEGGRGTLFTITLFDDQASLSAALSLAHRWSAEHRGMLEPGATEVAIGEVVAQKGL